MQKLHILQKMIVTVINLNHARVMKKSRESHARGVQKVSQLLSESTAYSNVIFALSFNRVEHLCCLFNVKGPYTAVWFHCMLALIYFLFLNCSTCVWECLER